MTNITTTITEIKSKVSMQEWEQRILDCQNSGMSVKAWCSENSISTISYYFHLCQIRESVLENNQLVSIEKPKSAVSDGIHIQSGNITITLPQNISPEQLTTVLLARNRWTGGNCTAERNLVGE